MKCPKCENTNSFITERSPDGGSQCLECGYKAPTKDFQQLVPGSRVLNQVSVNEYLLKECDHHEIYVSVFAPSDKAFKDRYPNKPLLKTGQMKQVGHT